MMETFSDGGQEKQVHLEHVFGDACCPRSFSVSLLTGSCEVSSSASLAPGMHRLTAGPETM